MIDIETLSQRSDAAVVSIGLAAFELEKGVTDTQEILIDLKQLAGHINPETVAWWMGLGKNAPGPEAREATFGGPLESRVSNLVAAQQLRAFVERNGGDKALVWANSPSFDLVILRNWFRAGNLGDFPVIYRNERDCRTVFAIGRDFSIDTSACWGGGAAHRAIDDACNQARAVLKIMTELHEMTYAPAAAGLA
jgi:hypothetical protein